MKARVKEEKASTSTKDAKQAERLQKKGKGFKGGRFVFSCEGLSKSLPDGTKLFSDLTFSLNERYRSIPLPSWIDEFAID